MGPDSKHMQADRDRSPAADVNGAPSQAVPFPPNLVGAPSLLRNRWLQLTAGIIGMVAVANFQYSWALFVLPLLGRFEEAGWTKVDLQEAFTLFVLAQTWLVPVEGYLADRFGPHRLIVVGGVLAALAWVICSQTSSLTTLYAAQLLCGAGSGIVYGISMGSALKWFPDRRGLAAGLTAAAFGAGSAATVLPISWTIEGHGYPTAFLWFGLAQGLVIVLAGLLMRFPKAGEVPAPAQSKVLQSAHDFTPGEMLRSPTFWLLYLMMMLGAVPGLLMMAQIGPVARSFGIDKAPVHWFGVTLAALPFAMMVDRFMGGLTRPVFGWISDHIGREAAIFLAFGLEGAALLLLIRHANDPVMFVLMSGVAFFGWGAVFSLFPAVSGDMFGRKFATTNYALLYTAKGAATLLVSLGIRLQTYWQNTTQDAQQGWAIVFALMIAADWLAALLALGALRPLRRWMTRRENLR